MYHSVSRDGLEVTFNEGGAVVGYRAPKSFKGFNLLEEDKNAMGGNRNNLYLRYQNTNAKGALDGYMFYFDAQGSVKDGYFKDIPTKYEKLSTEKLLTSKDILSSLTKDLPDYSPKQKK